MFDNKNTDLLNLGQYGIDGQNLMLIINDYLKQLFVDTPFEQGTTNQKISIGNFNFKNDNNTKFVNIERKIDYQGFNQIDLPIKFNAHAIDYNGIEFDT